MTKLRFSLIVASSIILTLSYLVGQTPDPAAWTLPIVVIAGGSLYASHSLLDQVHKMLKKLKAWTKHSDSGQSSPKFLHSLNRSKH